MVGSRQHAWWTGAVLASALTGCVMEVRVGREDTGTIDDPDAVVDLDEDGFSRSQGDCDDLDPLRGPAREPAFFESCDGVDNDCNELVDEDAAGVLACERTATFSQRLRLDVLFVVDRSVRNDFVRERASAAASEFLQHVLGSSADTHVGLVTMDLDDPDHQGQLVRPDGFERAWIDGGDSLLAATNFLSRAIVDSGVQVDGAEGGRAAVALSMHESTSHTNRGFFRPGAPLALVFVSGEEDLSDEPTLPDFLTLLDAAAPSVRAHAVVQTSPFGCDGKESGSEGESYLDLALYTNGLSQSVCEETYEPFFSALGQYSAFQGLANRYPLQEPARADSLVVEVELPGGFVRTLDPSEYGLTDSSRTLVILTDPPPPAGSEIHVRYLRPF